MENAMMVSGIRAVDHDSDSSDEDEALIEPHSGVGRRASWGRMVQYFAVIVAVVVVITISDIIKEAWMMQKFNIDSSNKPLRFPKSSPADSSVMDIPKNKNSDRGKKKSLKASKEDDTWKYSATVQISEEDEALSIREYVIQRMSNGKSEKQMKALTRDLEFAYRDVREMLSRPLRFPSIEQRVKIYMSNWYIPPCNDDARVIYSYTKYPDTDTYLLTLMEISLQQHLSEFIFDAGLSELQEPRIFLANSKFNSSDREGDTFDLVHFLDRDFFLECPHRYCLDMVENLLPSFDRLLNNESGLISDDSEASRIPILYQFGDLPKTIGSEILSNGTIVQFRRYPRMPVIQKARRRISSSLLKSVTDDLKYQCYEEDERRAPVDEDDDSLVLNIGNYQSIHLEPIIFKLKTQRHYGKIYNVAEADVIPWEEKKNQAVFRGSLTGLYPYEMKLDDIAKLSVVERCRLLERCWLAYSHASSKLVDVRLTEPYGKSRMIPPIISPGPNDMKFIANEPNVALNGNSLMMEELLEYKALIMLEGNDISSGLKWALFSNSIVLMPEPSLTSWSMEEMLIPWVHYVPINVTKDGNGRTATDTEEKMQWIIDNDEKAKEIVKAGKLWIGDLVLHPDVHEDELKIFDDIARRYVTHFAPRPEIV
jgi:Glycosyl transferase family 90